MTYSITRVLLFWLIAFIILYKGKVENLKEDWNKSSNYPVAIIILFAGLTSGVSIYFLYFYLILLIALPVAGRIYHYIKNNYKTIRWDIFWFICFCVSLWFNLLLINS